MGFADGTLGVSAVSLPPELFHKGSFLRDEKNGIKALEKCLRLLKRRNETCGERIENLNEKMESGAHNNE